ncbi:MAG: hypothetical protein QM811_17315, partial [Pirellulales bacterium]
MADYLVAMKAAAEEQRALIKKYNDKIEALNRQQKQQRQEAAFEFAFSSIPILLGMMPVTEVVDVNGQKQEVRGMYSEELVFDGALDLLQLGVETAMHEAAAQNYKKLTDA